MKTRTFNLCVLVAGLLLLPLLGSGQKAPDNPVIVELSRGNQRFASGHLRHPHADISRVRQTAKSQHPSAVVLACADSRVSPEILFDQGMGDLFDIRVAGNVANEDELASIEYGVEHLKASTIIVLGHTGCGAVTAVVERQPLDSAWSHLAHHIEEAVEQARRDHPHASEAELIDAAVESNVRESIRDLLKASPQMQDQVQAGKLQIVGAIYDLSTGRVRWLDRH